MTAVPMNQKNTSDDQEAPAVGAVGDARRCCLGFDRVDLGGRELEMTSLTLAPDQRRDRHPERSPLAVVRCEQRVGDRGADFGAGRCEPFEFAVDVGDLGGEGPVGEAQRLGDRFLLAKVRGQLVVERGLLFQRFEFDDVELVALCLDPGDLVHQGLGLTRRDHRLQLLIETLAVCQQLRAAGLGGVDRLAELSDLRGDPGTLTFPLGGTGGRVR